MDDFLICSAALTGYGVLDLQGTGMAGPYYDLVCAIVGTECCTALFTRGARIAGTYADNPDALTTAFRQEILSDPWLGPVARGVTKLWYLGQWDQLPAAWRAAYGNHPQDVTHIPSPAAYRAGLVWTTIDAHPMGDRQPGYGTWSRLPSDSP